MPLNTPNLAGDVTGGVYATSVGKIQGQPVASTTPTSGQVMTWDGSQWAPAASTGGGGGGANGLTYYLNQDTAADSPTTNLPGTPKQLGRSADTTQTTAASGTLTSGVWTQFAGFVSESTPQDPAVTEIPAGLWDFNVWAYGVANSNAYNSIRAKVFKYDGSNAPTLLSTSAAQQINSVSALYSLTALVPETTLLATDRIFVTLEALASGNNHTVTAQFGDGTPSHVHTSLSLVGGTGLWKSVAGVVQSPATLLVDADVATNAAIAQSKISGLTTDLAGKVPTTRTVTAGTGLTGGGDLSADRSFAVSYGSTAGTAAQGNDSRLSDARTPTAHKSTHATGGSDALTAGDIGAVAKSGDTMTGKLNTPAATTTTAGLNIGNISQSPASPIVGDVWMNGENMAFRGVTAQRTLVSTSVQANLTAGLSAAIGSATVPALNVQQNGAAAAMTVANVATSTTDCVTITNLGSGNSLVVNDETTPDSTRFAIANNGRVGIGVTPDASIALTLDTTGLRIGAAGPTLTTGTGSPEGVVTAPIGSLYLNLSGGASTTLYVKTSGTGNTGWTAK